MTAKELEKLILGQGWQYMPGHGKGSHRSYNHPNEPGRIIIPWHGRDLSTGTLNKILKLAGLK